MKNEVCKKEYWGKKTGYINQQPCKVFIQNLSLATQETKKISSCDVLSLYLRQNPVPGFLHILYDLPQTLKSKNCYFDVNVSKHRCR